jgi:hypothetical protein
MFIVRLREKICKLCKKKHPLRQSFFQISRPPLLLEGNDAQLSGRSLRPCWAFARHLASLHPMCFLTPPIGLRWSFARCLSSLHPAAHASPLPSAGGHLCCLLISFPPAPHLSGPLPHLMPPVPVLRAACWHPPLQERLVAMDTSSGSNSHGHKHRRRDQLVSCAPFREEAGRFGKRIDGASIFFCKVCTFSCVAAG